MEEIKKEFVPYELALKMRHLGFDEPCLGSYYNYSEENFKEDKFDYRGELNIEYSIYNENTYYILAPLFQQSFRWFREKYRLSVLIHDCLDDYIGEIVEWTIAEDKVIHEVSNRIDTYEEAELACLEKLIEIVVQNK
jgi:hypothetical protein